MREGPGGPEGPVGREAAQLLPLFAPRDGYEYFPPHMTVMQVRPTHPPGHLSRPSTSLWPLPHPPIPPPPPLTPHMTVMQAHAPNDAEGKKGGKREGARDEVELPPVDTDTDTHAHTSSSTTIKKDTGPAPPLEG